MAKFLKIDIKTRYIIGIAILVGLIELALQFLGSPVEKFFAFVLIIAVGQHFLVRMIYDPVNHILKQLSKIKHSPNRDISLMLIEAKAYDKFHELASSINQLICSCYCAGAFRSVEFLTIATNFFTVSIVKGVSEIIKQNNINTDLDREACFQSMLNEFHAGREEVYLRSQAIVPVWVLTLSREIDNGLINNIHSAFNTIVFNTSGEDAKLRLLQTTMRLFVDDYTSLIRMKVEKQIEEETNLVKRSVEGTS